MGERWFRRKLDALIAERKFYASKVTIDNDILDHTNDFDIDRLEAIWDTNSKNIKDKNKEILNLLKKMVERGYNIDDILAKYPFIDRLVYNDDELNNVLSK